MIRWLLWTLGGILLGGIVHLATVLAMPQAATQDAYSRLVPITPVNAMVTLPAPTSQSSIMPFMDPAFAAAVCRYDLSNGADQRCLHLGNVLYPQQHRLLRDQ
jgi:uncharacterized membrane protein